MVGNTRQAILKGMHTEKPFATTHMVAGVVLKQDGKYLLVQEAQPKVYGKWNLPGGRVDEGETLEQAAIREAREEAGFEVKLGAHLHIVHPSVEVPVLHAFAATITGGELAVDPHEILDAKWFTYAEVVAMKDELRNADYILGGIDKERSLDHEDN